MPAYRGDRVPDLAEGTTNTRPGYMFNAIAAGALVGQRKGDAGQIWTNHLLEWATT
ncbi:hypothetical protein G5B39_15485 (plasmid) [Rhodobacteraceae bacterium SC52]|nr:hypothetical protein G5B39_15485 [Rhodobacteraceae bacterium SC52]